MSDSNSPGCKGSAPTAQQRVKFGALSAAVGGGVCLVLPLVWYLAIGHRGDWGFVVAFFLAACGGIGGGVIGFVVGAIFPSRLGITAALGTLAVVVGVTGLVLILGRHELALLAFPASALLFLLAWLSGRNPPNRGSTE